MADYPGSVVAKPSIVTADMSAATSHSVDRGLAWDEIRAIELELGTTPSGSFSTVRLRLATKGYVDVGLSAKLNLTGGTLIGALNGTTAVFSGAITCANANVSDNLLMSNGFAELAEIADPAAPAANKGRLYVRDTARKSQLVVVFPTGGQQVIATQPLPLARARCLPERVNGELWTGSSDANLVGDNLHGV